MTSLNIWQRLQISLLAFFQLQSCRAMLHCLQSRALELRRMAKATNFDDCEVRAVANNGRAWLSSSVVAIPVFLLTRYHSTHLEQNNVNV
jgi:hypothetical protein